MEVVVERRKNAFTLIELLVVIAIIALLIGILLPALGQAKRSALNVVSISNMKSLNTVSANYAPDNSDRIYSYTWRGGVSYMIPGVPKAKTGTDDGDAAAFQNMDILIRATGRSAGDYRIIKFRGRLPHRRYSHLVLLDFLTDVQPEPIAASPFDRNLLDWQADQRAYKDDLAGSNLPYANGTPSNDYDTDPRWTDLAVLMRWPFASSYQTVPAAWNSDGIAGAPTFIPVANTPHLFQDAPGGAPLGRRRYTQVAHPSGKVHTFEEFDRFSDKDGLYFAYPEAKPNLGFFDGSVRSESSADSNPGWNPDTPADEWRQRYIPLDTFPLPKDGLENNNVEYCQRFRWTRHGLQGIDYGGKDVGRRQYNLPQEPAEGCEVGN